MNKPELPMTGGCLCGAVRYESSQAALDANYCHCRMCQRVSGAPVTVGVFFPLNAFRFVAGEPRIYRSSANVERGFCSDCGSRLTFRRLDADTIVVVVEVGSLDRPQAVAPTRHIGIESQLPWFEISDALPRKRIDD